MGRIRGSNRTCPECFDQMSGSKCYCYPPKKSKKSSTKEVKIRRTERVKRGRPDYYDVLEYERQARRERKPRARSKFLNRDVKNDKTNKDLDTYFKSNRMHLKEKKEKKKQIEVKPPAPVHIKEEDLEEIVLSKETIAKFDLILQDINRKIYASSWRRYT